MLSHEVAKPLAPGALGVGMIGAALPGLAMTAASAALRYSARLLSTLHAAVNVSTVAASVNGKFTFTPLTNDEIEFHDFI
jgi:hypothetical protein